MKKRKVKIQDTLDKLWRAIIKNRDGKCVRCGRETGLQSAHIFSRWRKVTRWDLDNGLCLCSGCHIFWAHKNPIEFAEFIKVFLGEEKYADLRERACRQDKVDKYFMAEQLETLKEIHGGAI